MDFAKAFDKVPYRRLLYESDYYRTPLPAPPPPTHTHTYTHHTHATGLAHGSLELILTHFNIVQLGFTGVNIIFLISAQNIDCGYSLEPPHQGGSNEYPQSMF